jgi:hypothetical protein
MGTIREIAVRNSQFLDRCFVVVLLLALVGFFATVAVALTDHEPRAVRSGLILQHLGQ